MPNKNGVTMRLRIIFGRLILIATLAISGTGFAADKPNVLIICGDDIGPYNISACNM